MEPYADEPLAEDVNFTNRKTALTQKEKPHNKILPFVMQFQPALKVLTHHRKVVFCLDRKKFSQMFVV